MHCGARSPGTKVGSPPFRRLRRRGCPTPPMALWGDIQPSAFTSLRPEIWPPASTLRPPKVGSPHARRLQRRCRPTPPPEAWGDNLPSAFTFRPSAGASASLPKLDRHLRAACGGVSPVALLRRHCSARVVSLVWDDFRPSTVIHASTKI